MTTPITIHHSYHLSGKICDDYDYCESCFQSKSSHRHPFMRIAEPDSGPIYVGRPGKRKGFGGNRRNNAAAGEGGGAGGDSHGQLLEAWQQCVKTISASSREATVSRLYDGSGGYWQSSGQFIPK